MESIIEIKNKIKKNLWYQSFKNKLNYSNWIDIENEIEETLKIFNKNFLKINEILENSIYNNSLAVNRTEIKTSLKLNKHELSYFEKFDVIEIKNGFLSIKKSMFFLVDNNLIKFRSEEFFENLFKELQDFMDVFNYYLSEIVNSFYKNIDSAYESSLEKIKSEINFHYTFNYTPTFEKLYSEINKTKYLHGRYDTQKHNIVMGIEENEELKRDKIFMFSKYYQKLFNNTDYQFLSELEQKSSVNYDFILFGHSLAENDQNYIIELFNIAKQFENTVSVFYINLNDKAQKLKNLLHIIGRKDIEILMKKKRLIFVKIGNDPFKNLINELPKSTNSWGGSEII